jgi:hypothetical protein
MVTCEVGWSEYTAVSHDCQCAQHRRSIQWNQTHADKEANVFVVRCLDTPSKREYTCVVMAFRHTPTHEGTLCDALMPQIHAKRAYL